MVRSEDCEAVPLVLPNTDQDIARWNFEIAWNPEPGACGASRLNSLTPRR
jgi:hypothetical protein